MNLKGLRPEEETEVREGIACMCAFSLFCFFTSLIH